jgi:hypothetical protein
MAVNKIDELLLSWRPLCEWLMSCEDEDDIVAMIKREKATRQRPYVIKRLSARYAKLRRRRELRENPHV